MLDRVFEQCEDDLGGERVEAGAAEEELPLEFVSRGTVRDLG